MYLATLFNEASGTILDTVPADRFDDGVAYVVETLGASNDYRIVAKKLGDMLSLVVYKNETVIATVEDREMAQDVGLAKKGTAIIEACDALECGNAGAIEALFKTA